MIFNLIVIGKTLNMRKKMFSLEGDLNGGKVTKENLLQWIEDYSWMIETIEEARQLVAKVDNNSYIGA